MGLRRQHKLDLRSVHRSVTIISFVTLNVSTIIQMATGSIVFPMRVTLCARNSSAMAIYAACWRIHLAARDLISLWVTCVRCTCSSLIVNSWPPQENNFQHTKNDEPNFKPRTERMRIIIIISRNIVNGIYEVRYSYIVAFMRSARHNDSHNFLLSLSLNYFFLAFQYSAVYCTTRINDFRSTRTSERKNITQTNLNWKL